MSSVDLDLGVTDRKLAELTTSVALDSAMLRGLPELIDSKLVAQHKRFTRLIEEQSDELIAELSSTMKGKLPANAASAPAPASPFCPIPSIPSGFARSFATAAAARSPAICMRSPMDFSRAPMVPITQEGNRNRAAFALRNGDGALRVLEMFGVEALLANSHLLTEEETVCEELNNHIQEMSASGDKSLESVPAGSPLTLGPVGSSPRFG